MKSIFYGLLFLKVELIKNRETFTKKSVTKGVTSIWIDIVNMGIWHNLSLLLLLIPSLFLTLFCYNHQKRHIMKFLFLLSVPLFMFAQVHYAKVEAYESVVLKSAVSALVLDVDLNAEGKMISDKRVIHLDDTLDKIDLEATQESVILLKNMLGINKEIEQSLREMTKRQEGYFNRISTLSTVSKTQKDNAYSSFASAKTQYLNTKEKIVSLEKQILDMQYKIEQLRDSITKKSIVLKNKYLYQLMVRKGDFVTPGSALAKVKDASSAKLVLFLEPDELEKISEKNVYLDGRKTVYKIDKLWKIADEKFISSYRAEIYIPAPKESFSRLVKVEIK